MIYKIKWGWGWSAGLGAKGIGYFSVFSKFPNFQSPQKIGNLKKTCLVFSDFQISKPNFQISKALGNFEIWKKKTYISQISKISKTLGNLEMGKKRSVFFQISKFPYFHSKSEKSEYFSFFSKKVKRNKKSDLPVEIQKEIENSQKK